MNRSLAGSLVCSAVYTVTIATGPFPGRWGVKTASTALLALFARRYPLLASGLAASALGDALLDLSSAYFVYGLIAFLCAHICYIICFLKSAKAAFRGGKQPRNSRSASSGDGAVLREFLRSRRTGSLPAFLPWLVLAYSLVFSAWIVPATGALQLPVVFYVGAITAMVIAAIQLGAGWVALGAFLFLISDSVLAANRFRLPVPARDWIVWLTYYAGQFGIAWGYWRTYTGNRK